MTEYERMAVQAQTDPMAAVTLRYTFESQQIALAFGVAASLLVETTTDVQTVAWKGCDVTIKTTVRCGLWLVESIDDATSVVGGAVVPMVLTSQQPPEC